MAVFQSLFVKHTMKGDSYVRNFRPRGEIECARVYFRAFFRACLENKDLAKRKGGRYNLFMMLKKYIT